MNGTHLTGKGKLLSKATIKLDNSDLKIIQQEVQKALVKNIKKDMALSASTKLVTLPKSKEFVDSFKVSVTNKGIEITSDWPTAEVHTSKDNPERPYPMTWLTQPNVSKARIQVQGGVSLVRTTPSNGKTWTHPGFKRYDFLERSIKEGYENALKVILPKKVGQLLKTHNPLK